MKLSIFVSIKGIVMKTKLIFIFILLLIFPSLLRSQEKQLFGFDELDWDSSKEAVKDFMNTRYDMLPGYEKNDAIGYQGGRYLNQNLFIWVYFFNDDGLQEVDLVVKNNDRPVGGIFHEVVHSLTEEYDDPDLYKPDDWIAEWFYYDLPGKHLNATIKVSPYSNEDMTSIKISFLKAVN
jgi:hypothetical protein